MDDEVKGSMAAQREIVDLLRDARLRASGGDEFLRYLIEMALTQAVKGLTQKAVEVQPAA